MPKFVYNNAKNANTDHISFKLNCGYHSCVSHKKNVDPRFKLKSAEKLSNKLRELIIVYWKNSHHAKKPQKQTHDNAIKPRSYTTSNKVLLNTKYIQTKQNWKLEAKFFKTILCASFNRKTSL